MQINFRVSESEKSELQGLASRLGFGLSQYLRYILLSERAKSKPVPIQSEENS